MSHPDVEKDYYSILGAGETASQDEIERLYKRLAMRHHPDRGGNAEEMKAINEADGVLGNDATRCTYDAQRPPHRKPLSAPASSLSSPPALLENTASGRLVGAMFFLMAGLLFLFLLRFYYIRFLWPLFVLAAFVVMVGVLKIHAVLVYTREGIAPSHPLRRYVWMQEMAFWLIVCLCVYGIYLMLRAI
ncbi:MAG: DnaJ domain-containing protein [Pyrinomonadaceae bacterium]